MKRKRLPTTRSALTIRITIDEYKIYFSIGLYKNGQPGEIFIHNIEDPKGRVDDGGAMLGFAEAWATAASILLQMGYSVEDFVNKFRGSKFAPSGFTDDPDIHMASSIPDYICRWMERRFCKEV